MNFKEWLILTEKIMIKDQEFRNPLIALKHIQKTHPNPENLVVTFTKIDKVGLNPQSEYGTPLGIYLYPLNYVIERKLYMPFAGNKPYFNVCEFTRPEKILHMTSDVSNQDGMELLNVFPKEQVDKASEKIINYGLRSNNGTILFSSNYSKLWLVTRKLAKEKPLQWNANLRKCGIDGFVDHGTGTIHPNESTQCVVFSASALKLLHSIDNPIYEKKTDKFGVDTYDMKKNTDKYNIGKMEEEEIIRMLQSRRILDVKNLLSKATDKNKIAELIIKYKTILDNYDIYTLLNTASNKEQIAKSLQKETDNMSKLSDEDVFHLLIYATDKDEMAEVIVKYKPKLSGDNYGWLFQNVTSKDKIIELIIKEKKEFEHGTVRYFIQTASDKEQIAKSLQKETDNMSKLYYDDIRTLLNTASVFYINGKVSNKEQIKIAKIINKYHTKKTPEIQELIDKYLQPQTIAAK